MRAAGDPELRALLRRYRLAAGLSQEALAERAGMSVRGVSDLERGLRRLPYPATLARLSDALGLGPDERAALLAARNASDADLAEPDVHRAFVSPTGALGQELSSFVGRQYELTRIVDLLTEASLVTLAGPGGAGKTRLATRVCREVDNDREIVVVELAPVGDPSLVPRAIAAALGVAEDSRRPLQTRLADTLGASHLLVLDNCEHLVEACAELVDVLLRACAGLRVLATSREPLGVEGEVVYRVPPLGLPASDDLQACAESEAVQLFLQRARAARNDFQLSVDNAPLLARLCRQLGGLPLALELAAARVASLPLDDIVVRLEGTTRLLSGGPRSAPPRQRTIEAAIAWSYALLAEDERRLFDRLSVFAGGFALDQAEALVPAGADALELLARLVTRSMVQLELSDESARYRLLEPLRQFGHDRLLKQDVLDETCRQHARLMLELVERAGRELQGPLQLEWCQRLDLEWDNVRAALDWAESANQPEVALRLAAPLQLYWSRPDRQAEGRERLERVLAIAAAAYAEARPMLEAMNGGRRTPSGMLHNLGYVELGRGNPRAAARLFLEAADGYRKVGQDRRGVAECVIGLAAVSVRLRQAHLAARLFGSAGATLDELGTSMTPTKRADYERARAELAACLPSEQVARYEGAGRLLELDVALDLARQLAAAPPAPTERLGALTARELEVAQLLARGLRNRQIADALVITDKTAANHVQRVLEKLGVGSRAEIAARADELGLSTSLS